MAIPPRGGIVEDAAFHVGHCCTAGAPAALQTHAPRMGYNLTFFPNARA